MADTIRRELKRTAVGLICVMLLAACASEPKVPYSTDFDPLAEMPQSNGGIRDDRGRFREIFCAVLEAHGRQLDDYMNCEDALTRVGMEPPGTGDEVYLGQTRANFLIGFVPGIGWECIRNWLKFDNYGPKYLDRYGYIGGLLAVDGLSSTSNNAAQINSRILDLPEERKSREIILIGYSKGAADVLDFIVSYPETAGKVVAVISVAGAVQGSPLALESSQQQANLLIHIPGSECDEGDAGGVRDLRPDVRKEWLKQNPLPEGIRYYSVVAFPGPDRMSSGLKPSWKKLAKVDARNDSQVIFYDQVIPGSTLIAFPNADHWAMAVPVARHHAFAANTFVNRNNYPREAFLEAILRYVEEDLARQR